MDNYFVYLRDRNLSLLGRKKKSIWKIVSTKDNYSKEITLANIVTGVTFSTTTDNIVPTKALARKGLLKKEYFNEAAFSRYENLLKQEIDDIANTLKDQVTNNTLKSRLIQEKMEEESKSIKISRKTKEISMLESKVKAVVDNNVDAAQVAASITAGKALNQIAADKVVPHLPLMVKGYANTVIGRVVIANIADFAVKQFMPNNKKAALATKAMMEASMVDLLGSFDFEKIVNEVINSVELPVD